MNARRLQNQPRESDIKKYFCKSPHIIEGRERLIKYIIYLGKKCPATHGKHELT